MGPCDAARAEAARSSGGIVRLGSAPAQTALVTLHFEQDPEMRTPVLPVLGHHAHVLAFDRPQLDDVVRMLGRELSCPRLGTRAVVNSLIDMLLVQVVRLLLEGSDDNWPDRLRGILDPAIRDALALLREAPAQPWTTASLADAVHVSRATLTRRFPAATGWTPLEYLTRWRMDLAAVQLRDTDRPIEAVASVVGYSSPHSFSRAFRRDRGYSPGEFRTRARLGRSEPADRLAS